MTEIEPRDVKQFALWLTTVQDPRRPDRLLAASTVRQHMAVLRALLADATEEGLLRMNPAAGIRVSIPEGPGTGREPKDDVRAMTRDELDRLLRATASLGPSATV